MRKTFLTHLPITQPKKAPIWFIYKVGQGKIIVALTLSDEIDLTISPMTRQYLYNNYSLLNGKFPKEYKPFSFTGLVL